MKTIVSHSQPLFVTGKIYARKGRYFVQSSYDSAWQKYGVFGANPSQWKDTLIQALMMLDIITANDN